MKVYNGITTLVLDFPTIEPYKEAECKNYTGLGLDLSTSYQNGRRVSSLALICEPCNTKDLVLEMIKWE